MKSFLRIVIVIFSIIILGMSVITILTVNEVITAEQCISAIKLLRDFDIIHWAVCAVATVLGIFSIISIVGSDVLTNEMRGGIILPLNIGNVNISTQTFENIVLNVTKKYGSVKATKVAVKTRETGVVVDIFVYVLQDTVISDITEKLQLDVKETVLKQTTVAVNNVNVKVKGIYAINETKE